MIKSLISLKLKSMLIGSAIGKDKNGKARSVSKLYVTLFAFLYILLGATFMGLAFVSSYGTASVMVPMGGSDVFYGFVMLITFSVIFIVSIFETKSELFECKDNDILLPLPIKSGDIVISRIFSVLLVNYALGCIVIIPSTVAYLICGGDPVGIFGALYILVTIVPAATALSAWVGYLVAEISKRMRSKTLVNVLLSVIFLTAYFVVYFMLISRIEVFIEDGEQIIEGMLKDLAPIGNIGAVYRFSPPSTFIYTLIAVTLAAFSYFVISKKYRVIVTSTAAPAKKTYSARAVSGRSAFVALCSKEMKRFLSSANYILNGGIGVIFAVGITVFIIISAPTLFELGAVSLDGVTLINISDIIGPIGAIVPLFCYSMNMISASSVSLEGENLSTLRSLPVSGKSVLIAKTVPHMIVNAPISALCGLALAIGLRVELVYYPFYVLIPAVFNVLMAFIGVIINVAVPKFKYPSEISVVKQSAAVFFDLLVNTLVTLAVYCGALAGALNGAGLLSNVIILVALVALSIICYFIIVGPSSRRFERLTV